MNDLRSNTLGKTAGQPNTSRTEDRQRLCELSPEAVASACDSATRFLPAETLHPDSDSKSGHLTTPTPRARPSWRSSSTRGIPAFSGWAELRRALVRRAHIDSLESQFHFDNINRRAKSP